MTIGIRGRAGMLCLVLGLSLVLPAAAEDWVDTLPTSDTMVISADTLPAPLHVYTPRSALNTATMGSINSDVDYFMDPYDFTRLSIENYLFFAGVDEQGLNLGFGAKFGSLYFGVSYGGSIVDQLFQEITNQDVDLFSKQSTATTDNINSANDHTELQVVDPMGTRLSGKNESSNTLQILMGSGIWGVKLGLAQYMKSIDSSSENLFEFSLKPLFEVGFNFKVGGVRLKAGLRAAMDFHDYIYKTSQMVNYFSPAPPIPPGAIASTQYPGTTIKTESLLGFKEVSAGLTLGADFSSNPATIAELRLDADVAFRLYDNMGMFQAMATLDILDPVIAGVAISPSIASTSVVMADIFPDVRVLINPSFVYKFDLNEMFSLGVKVKAGIGVDLLSIDRSDGTSSSSSDYLTIRAVPDVAVGGHFKIWPEHFSLYGGLGIELLSLKTVIENSTNSTAGTDTATVTNTTGLPAARLAAGFMFNFTASTAIEVLVFTKNLDIDQTALTLLLTVKK